VFYERGRSYEALGNKEQAKQDFVRAAALEPEEGYEKEIKEKLTEYGIAAKPQAHGSVTHE
jgi:lipoprotein NlpI